MEKYDFSGWATRNDLLCVDGRTIKKDAFKNQNGKTVPLVWGHTHSDPNRVLGHAVLENRDEGVYAYCSFNDSESGLAAKKLVKHGDVRSLSICAGQLKQAGANVVHGVIYELSLVLAGANPGAFIDSVMEHGDASEDLGSLIPAGIPKQISKIFPFSNFIIPNTRTNFHSHSIADFSIKFCHFEFSPLFSL